MPKRRRDHDDTQYNKGNKEPALQRKLQGLPVVDGSRFQNYGRATLGQRRRAPQVTPPPPAASLQLVLATDPYGQLTEQAPERERRGRRRRGSETTTTEPVNATVETSETAGPQAPARRPRTIQPTESIVDSSSGQAQTSTSRAESHTDRVPGKRRTAPRKTTKVSASGSGGPSQAILLPTSSQSPSSTFQALPHGGDGQGVADHWRVPDPRNIRPDTPRIGRTLESLGPHVYKSSNTLERSTMADLRSGAEVHAYTGPAVAPHWPVPPASRRPSWRAHILHQVGPGSSNDDWTAMPSQSESPTVTTQPHPDVYTAPRLYAGPVQRTPQQYPETLSGPAYGSSEQRHPGVYEARTSSSSLAGALEERPLWTSVGLQRNTGTIAPWQQSVGPYPAAPVRMGLRNVHRRTTTSERQIPSARRYPHTGPIPGPDHSQQREEAWLSPASGHPPMFAPDPPPYTARALQPQTALRTDLEYPVPAPNLGRQQQLPYADPTYPPYEMRSYPAASSATFDAGGIPEYARQGSTQLTPPSLPVLVHASGAIADPYGAASSMSFANIPSYPVTQGPISDASRDETARSPSYEAFSSSLDAYSFEAFQPELEGSD